MAQRTIATTPEVEITAEATAEVCRHHWVIQPADGPVSNGLCQVCGETREFKNYVESATWGDSRTTGKGTSASASVETTSDDEPDEPDLPEDDDEPDADIAAELVIEDDAETEAVD
ncbi:MAG: hypothetical protein HQ475_04485 [SAR202 cluster bacterium]|nr:hypothetical protein [SAR202 cluster bacterium]